MRFDTKDKTPGCGDRRFQHVPKLLLWCVQNSRRHWLEMKLRTTCKRAGLFNDFDLFTTSQWALGISVCFFFGIVRWAGGVEQTAADVWAGLFVLVFSLYSCFLSADAHGFAHGRLSKLHLFYNLGVRFYLVLVKTRTLYLHLLSSRLLCHSDCSLALFSPFCRHQLQSCWLTSDPINLFCGFRFTVNFLKMCLSKKLCLYE